MVSKMKCSHYFFLIKAKFSKNNPSLAKRKNNRFCFIICLNYIYLGFLSFNIFRLLGNLLIRMISWRHAIIVHTNKYYVMHPLLLYLCLFKMHSTYICSRYLLVCVNEKGHAFCCQECCLAFKFFGSSILFMIIEVVHRTRVHAPQ